MSDRPPKAFQAYFCTMPDTSLLHWQYGYVIAMECLYWPCKPLPHKRARPYTKSYAIIRPTVACFVLAPSDSTHAPN